MKAAQDHENVITLAPPDKLDASNSRQLITEADVARKQGVQQVAVDMSQVRLISNCGLLALDAVANQLNDAGLPPLQLLNLQPHIKHALNASGFHNYAELYS